MSKQSKKKVLVVDDEPDLHSLLRVRLEMEGFEVFDAYNGDEALKLAKHTKFDVAIIDVMMPGMNGFEVCRQLKAEHPHAKIVIYTAKVEGVDAGKAKEAGADLFTVKTNNLVLLLASIKRILGEESAR